MVVAKAHSGCARRHRPVEPARRRQFPVANLSLPTSRCHCRPQRPDVAANLPSKLGGSKVKANAKFAAKPRFA
jgi:hypothetical protein